MIKTTQQRELNYNLFKLETTENIHEELYYVNEMKRILYNITCELESRIKKQRELDIIFTSDEDEIRKNYEYYRKRVEND